MAIQWTRGFSHTWKLILEKEKLKIREIMIINEINLEKKEKI